MHRNENKNTTALAVPTHQTSKTKTVSKAEIVKTGENHKN